MTTRKTNASYRPREHLRPDEVAAILEAARSNRHGERDACLILTAYRHGLRASEVCGLQFSQLDLAQGLMHVARRKNGKPSTHPIRGDELAALRELRQRAQSPFVFVSERGTPFSIDGYNKMIKRAGRKAGLPFEIHSHMLRHSCGYKLASDKHDTRAIQGYLGHCNIEHTVKYTELAPDRFRDFFSEAAAS